MLGVKNRRRGVKARNDIKQGVARAGKAAIGVADQLVRMLAVARPGVGDGVVAFGPACNCGRVRAETAAGDPQAVAGVHSRRTVETPKGDPRHSGPTIASNVVAKRRWKSGSPVVPARDVDIAGDQPAISSVARCRQHGAGGPGIGRGVINLGGGGGSRAVVAANDIDLVRRPVAGDDRPQGGGAGTARPDDQVLEAIS